jgi:Tfp pilus assembly protein PilF
MMKRFRALLLAAVLAAGATACAYDAEDHAEAAEESRQDAARETAEGDTADASEDLRDAARHDSAAGVK